MEHDALQESNHGALVSIIHQALESAPFTDLFGQRVESARFSDLAHPAIIQALLILSACFLKPSNPQKGAVPLTAYWDPIMTAAAGSKLIL